MKKNTVLKYALNFDVIWLSEIKTIQRISVPGFQVYHNVDVKAGHRGGISLLLKHWLIPFILNIDCSEPGQIWVRLSCCEDLILGGCYIPPIDSDYREAAMLGSLQAKLMTRERGLPLLMGDLNARLWNIEMLQELGPGGELRYDGLEDLTVNEQGRIVLQMCKDTGCIVLNHLGQLGGGLSFKKTTWISELDVCIAAREAFSHITSLRMEKDIPLPSDHAPLEMTLNLRSSRVNTESILRRTAALGSHSIPKAGGPSRGPPLQRVDEAAFRESMQSNTPPDLDLSVENIDEIVMNLNYILNQAARASRPAPSHDGPRWDPQQDRWTRIIQTGDDRSIWRAIGWNGCLASSADLHGDRPSDIEFKSHFEALFNAETHNALTVDVEDAPYIPLLDSPFTAHEINKTVRTIKNKAFIGTCAGLFRWLPVPWISFIAAIFNAVFSFSHYPESWRQSLLIILFKGGEKNACGNYRGISIMDSTAKLYDLALNNRLSQWLAIDKAQAGAQKGRGCIEQILTLRLLIDYAKKTKRKLFLLYVDFQKAYDRVPRAKLMQRLKERGCGGTMLKALAALYQRTSFVLESATIDANDGVRQGAPTSCVLFVLYIDELMRMLRERHPENGFLGPLQALLLMDDTVIMATSREQCIKKLETLHEFCELSGMRMNQKKTKLMVINGDHRDRAPLSIDTECIGYSAHYVYLGAHILDDGRMTSVMKKQVQSASKHVIKFNSFVQKNSNMPFSFKARVMKAALISAMLYSCESWITGNFSSINKQYMSAVKALLGVRLSTPNTLCLLEAGLSEVSSIIKQRQTTFMKRFMAKTTGEEPLSQALQLCTDTRMAQGLQAALAVEEDLEEASSQRLREECRRKAQSASRFATYLEMNPHLEVHALYTEDHSVPDSLRISFSRLRLSSHRLRVETGRWMRIPREERLCNCSLNEIQNEEHAVLRCDRTLHLRGDRTLSSMTELFESDMHELCKLCYSILAVYQ